MATYYTDIVNCTRGDEGDQIIVSHLYDANGDEVTDSVIITHGDGIRIRPVMEASSYLLINRADRTPGGKLVLWVNNPIQDGE